MLKTTLAGAVLAAAAAAPAAGQLASPSTAGLGMGDNYTAVARGFSAIAWNPALLGLAGSPSISFTILTPRGIAGLDPVSLADLKEWEGQVVPVNVKEEWLAAIRSEGSQAGTGGADITWLALQAGPFGLQASTSVRAVSDISPGIAELLLFGNADDNGNARTIELSGSTLRSAAYSTVAAGLGHSFLLGEPGGKVSLVAIGVTAKYTMGHVLALSQESTGQASAGGEVTLSFPMIHTPLDGDEPEDEFEPNSGGGFGVDAGVALQTGIWTFSAAAQNLVNTFEWDESLLRYRAGTILFSIDERRTDFEPQDLAAAPAALRELAEDMKFKPSFALGAMMEASAQLRVSADARFGGAAGLATRPATQVGAGAEYRVAPFLPVRVGAAFVKLDDENSGFQFGGGVGLDLAGINLSASAMRRNTDLGTDNLFMLTLVSAGGR